MPQFVFELRKINWCRAAAFEVGDLAIDTRPVAGIVDVQVDAYRNAMGASGNDWIDILHSRAIAAVVVDAEHVEQVLWRVVGGGQPRTAAETVSWYDESGDHTVAVMKAE